MRLLPTIDEAAADGIELEDYITHGAEQHFSLLGENEAARMTMKQWRAQVSFQSSNLTAYRRLAKAQGLARMRKRPSVSGRLKDAQLIPIHDVSSARAGLWCTSRFFGRDGCRLPLFGGRPFWLPSGKPALGLERGHAAETGGGDRLAEDVIGDVAGGEHALDAGRR